MKKFVIRDEDNNKYEVEEMEVETKKDEKLPETTPTKDDATLSEDEIGALKKLASVADKLIGLVSTTDEDKDKDIETTDEDEDEDDEDKVIDTDEEEEEKTEKIIRKDSKKSFGSIESKVKNNDSLDNQELDVAAAWQKRYGGNK